MLTTTDNPLEIDRCFELGCNAYVTKPIAYDAFIQAIQRLCGFSRNDAASRSIAANHRNVSA